jgi:hypothetical protein
MFGFISKHQDDEIKDDEGDESVETLQDMKNRTSI